jgi:5-methylcytosine-specific restriction protein A
MHLRVEPLCRKCRADGIIEAATDVDHIVPLRKGGTSEESNLQSLCHSCHSRKTNQEMGHAGHI